MKKVFLILVAAIFCGTAAFAQLNLSVDLNDEIYGLLDYAQLKGYCSFLSGVKPYTAGRILDAIDEILEHEDQLKSAEIKYLEEFKEKYTTKSDKKMSAGHVALENDSEKWHFSFLYDFGLNTSFSGGVYTKSKFNEFGFDIIPEFNFRGDITKYISYGVKPFFDGTTMPLYECTENYDEYSIGYYWYDEKVKLYTSDEVDPENKYTVGHGETFDIQTRTIQKYLNTSYLPFSYKKPWSGQIYYITNFSADGLEGWAMEPGISGGLKAEIRSSLLNNRINIGIGRNDREWAGMDNGSSLVLNSSAQPFFAYDMTVQLFPWLHFSNLVGILEYPNQDYINNHAFDMLGSGKDDAMFFQNGFSINMIDLDWKYLHLDFGSNVIFPKRFELGYMFPLAIYVEYQNHIGDYDNMALFGDVKVRKPGLGEIWASLYLDEINVKNDVTTQSRVMFAGQLGSKIVIPGLSGATLSMRYTKVEPYCYTHHAINYTPWYASYLCESYTNNGAGLGYYLDPNSDEFLLKFETKPTSKLTTGLKYQFIRHGADYGSMQVPGSSYYSEMPTKKRDQLKKAFLHDGAYNWMHIVNLSGAYRLETKKKKSPLEISGNVGFLYSYYTSISSDYKRDMYITINQGTETEKEICTYGNAVNSNGKTADKNTPFHFINTDEYPVMCGLIMGVGLKAWFF